MVLPDLKKGGLVASIEDLVSDLRFNIPFGCPTPVAI